MVIPLRYHFRNVWVRWRSTLAAVLGVAVVVAVFVLVQALAIGLEKAASQTGDARNLLVVRRGATAESTSQINRTQLAAFSQSSEIARTADGRSLFTADTLVILNLLRLGQDSGEANVVLRGVGPNTRELRPQVRLIAGRWFEAGQREVVVSQRLAKRFAKMNVGESFKVGLRELKVVGHFDGGGSAFDSEAWMDSDEARLMFERDAYSSVLLRPTDDAAAKALIERLEADKRLGVRLHRETAYYKDQTKSAMLPRILGNFLATTMSIGATFAAMNAMFASIGARTREVGTLKVLGFRPFAILAGFMIEGVALSILGGALGVGLAAAAIGFTKATGMTFGTLSFESFSESVFELAITPQLLVIGLAYSAAVGLIGGLLPALRAARLGPIAALKSS